MSQRFGIGAVERFAEGGVQGVDRTVSFRHLVPDLVADPHLHGGFRHQFVVAVTAHFHVVLEPFEMWAELAGTPLHQQVERSPRGFELVALVSPCSTTALRILSISDAVAWMSYWRGQGYDVRAARQLADQNPSFVAHPLRIDVLVAGGGSRHGVHVHAALVRKGTRAHKRLLGAKVHVGHFVHEARQFGQPLEIGAAQHLVTLLLQRQIRR